jgi:peptidoglycan hydrolase-like protein with peptidoglycan-binding domain
VASINTDVAWSEKCARSLERSRRRRAAARAMRRRKLRVRGGTASLAVVALMVATTGAGMAVGHATGGPDVRAQTQLLSEQHVSSGPAVAAVQRALGIPADGVFGPRTTANVRVFQTRHGLLVDGIVGPQTSGALGLSAAPAQASAPSAGSAPAQAQAASPAAPAAAPALTGSSGTGVPGGLQQIAQCESGGNPSAVGGGGRYRGKYQFDVGTWRAMGGSGDPAAASEAEQDRRAAQLYAQRGSAPWGACG